MKDIEKFEKEYRESQDETEDILKAYVGETKFLYICCKDQFLLLELYTNPEW